MATITSTLNANINDVANLFIGVASGTAANSSPDGIIWTARTLPTANWYNVAFGNDIAVAISNNTNGVVAASSVNGITWVSRTIPAAGPGKGWYGLAYGNGLFVATAGGAASTSAATSDNGLYWTGRTIGNGDWRAVAYGNGTFIAIGYNSDLVQKSTNGITWISGTTLPVSSNWIDITYDSSLNRFVAISNTNDTIAAYSDDAGNTWTQCTLPTTSTWRSICTNGNGFFVAVSNTSGAIAAYSNGGIIWSGATLPATAVWSSVCFGTVPNVFCASSAGSTNAAISTDGITWVSRTQANATFLKTIYAPVTWRTGDSLTINNNATVTVDSDQNKFWSSMTITNGNLVITNTSTTTANRFVTGRISGAAAQAITPGSGLGSINITGDWIQIGSGDTTANQIMTTPYTDYIPCVWVETGSTYEIWLNVSSAYGGTLRTYDESLSGLSQVSTGQRGKFFVQIPNSVQDQVFILTGSTTLIGSRTVIVSNTSGIYPGASITGMTASIPASSIVEQIVDATTLIINNAATVSSNSITVMLLNPLKSQYTNQIVFGDGVNGNKLLMGQKVKIPNLMLTSDTPVNLGNTGITNAVSQAGMSFVLTNGGRCSINTCLFDDAYHNFNQAQSLSLTNVGFSVPPAISEVYDLSMNSVGIGLVPTRRVYTNFTGPWGYRDSRNALQNVLPMSYITGAIINNLATVTSCIYFATTGSLTVPLGHLNISYSNDLTVSNIRCYSLFEQRGYHYAIALPAAVNSSTFSNIESYGCPAISLQQSSNNTFSNIIHSDSMFNYSWSYNAGTRVTYDPETSQTMVNGQKYYFKSRTYFTRDRQEYTESREYSATPFLASGGSANESIFPDYITAYCSDNGSAFFGWTNRSPVHNNPSYQIHYSTQSGFTISSATTCFSTNTPATVTWTHQGNKATLTSSAAARTFTFSSDKTIRVSGTTAINFLTDTDGVTVGGGTTDFRVGDTLVITATVNNNGTYTITNVTANHITVKEDLIVEANAASMVLKAHRNGTNKFVVNASAGRTLTFNAGKTITASSGSFINDGYKVGDVITVSGTTANNGIFTITTLTRLIITVLQTMVTESAYSSNATIIPPDIQNDNTYYYKFRKFDSASLYSDSAEIEVTPTIPQTNKNICLRGTDFAAPWVASNLTVGSASRISPFRTFLTTAANQIPEALLLTSTAAGATLTQPINVTSGGTYTFSLYVCNNATYLIPYVTGEISFDGTAQQFSATTLWTKVSLTKNISTLSTSTGATNVQIKIYNNAQSIVAIGGKFESGSTMKPYLANAATPIINVNEVRDITLVRSWCRGYGQAQSHSGIELTLAAAVAGEMWTEIYCSSVKGFTPSPRNMVMNTLVSSAHSIVLNNTSLNNTFTNFRQEGKDTPQSNGLLYLALSSSNNKFKNFTYDLTGCYMDGFISMNTLSNDNLIKNWTISNWRNYVATTTNPIKQATNAFAGLTIENMIMNNSDFQLLNIGSNIILKGMNGANATPANAATTYSLGSTSDGIGIAYTAVYDTIFNELYFTQTTGALDILFNASAKETKPYVLSGSSSTVPVFSNGGKLYFLNTNGNEYVEYTWPHKIFGISGFTSRAIKMSGVDLGTTTDRLEGVKIEYAIATGETYSAYKEARIYSTGTTGMNMVNESVSASDGFYLKLKLTSMLGMKYNARATGKNFVQGEIIKGSKSLATATVVRDIITVSGNAGTGTLWISGVTGTFKPGETIVRNSDSDARATNVATNTAYATFPSFTSYINGFQIYTNIDYTSLYPEDQTTLTLTGLQVNSEIRIFLHGTTTELDGIENSTTSFEYKYVYAENTYVDIVIMNLNYQYYRIDNLLLPSTDSSIPIQQILDRVYNNP